MSRAYLFIVVIGLITPLSVSKHAQFYRRDYTYIKEYDAFYKVHWDTTGLSWSSAFMACDSEGSKLFYPSGDEWTVVKNLTDALPVAPNTTEMYVGLHDEFQLGEFITIDGISTDSPLNAEGDFITRMPERCMVMDYLSGQFRVTDCNGNLNEDPLKPFVCKRVDDESCPTIDNEYKYVRNVQKCYKVNIRPKTWQVAMQTCYMEGGILAVLEQGADALKDSIKENQQYFVGFRKMFSSEDFYTVKGKMFDDSYFRSWYNDYNNQGNDCGVMIYNSQQTRMQVEPCFVQLPFICEMVAK